MRRPSSPDLISALFDGTPSSAWSGGTIPAAALVETLRRGGFPAIVASDRPLTDRAISRQVRDDTMSAIGDHVLADERFDALRAGRILDTLARLPGAILNASRLGRDLELDRRTVERYVDALERRFLVHRLHNLGVRPGVQSWSRVKVHPVDTSISVESLERAGRDLTTDREDLGAVLESYVVNELLAHASWDALPVTPFYWRETTPTDAEVDLVLVDGADRRVAIEVKAARTVRSNDLRGIRILAARGGFHRAFVFYTGDDVARLDDSIWAIPISALATISHLSPQSSPTPTPTKNAETTLTADPVARLFVSYVHEDNDYFGGAITAFADDLARAFRVNTGNDIEVVIDTKALKWGDDWKSRLSEEVDAAQFMLAVVTPNYLKSDACRDELLQFSAAAESLDKPRRLLSLIWIPLPTAMTADRNDPALRIINESQFKDGSGLRDLERGSTKYRRALESLAHSLADAVEASRKPILSTTRPPSEADETSLLEILAEFEDSKDEITNALQSYIQQFMRVGEKLSLISPPPGATPKEAQAAIARGARDLTGPAAQLETASHELTRAWATVDRVLGAWLGSHDQRTPRLRNR